MRFSSRPSISRAIWAAALASAGLLLAAPAVTAQGFTFVKVVDTATAIPGGTGFFTSFTQPSLDGGAVAFFGDGSGGQRGVYTTAGGSLTTVANTATTIPDGTGTFTFNGFGGDPAISAGKVVFKGGNGSTLDGLYSNVPGPLTRVADTTTLVPSGGGAVFSTVGPAATLSSGTVAFAGSYSTGSGIFTNPGGILTAVANNTTPIPSGTGTFLSFGSSFGRSPSISSGTVAFVGSGSSGQVGIYTNPGGTLGLVANETTAIPSGTGTFTGFGDPAISVGAVAFRAGGSGGQLGVYTNASGPLTMVANLTTTIPGGTGAFSSFADGAGRGIAISGGTVAFLGLNSSSHTGIYTNLDGTLLEVIGPGDMLDGKTVGIFGLSFASTGISGRDIAFSVTFTDLSRGIYIATLPVPEPTGVLAVCASAAYVGWRFRKTRRTAIT